MNSQTELTRTIQVNPVGDAVGAEIVGVDLADMSSTAVLAELRRAFDRHHLLVFREQTRLTNEQFYGVAQAFGNIETKAHRVFTESGKASSGLVYQGVHLIQNLDQDGNLSEKPYNNANFFWHSDKAYYPGDPSYLTMLHAVELPPTGGDTEFANMVQAYEALDDATKRQIEGLKARHSYAHALRSAGQPLTEQEERRDPPEAHPIVRQDAKTGVKSLYLGMFVFHIEGMDDNGGRALVQRLTDHATQPQFVYRHQWRLGDVVMWDNRFLLHRATRSYEMSKHRRTLRRCVVQIAH